MKIPKSIGRYSSIAEISAYLGNLVGVTGEDGTPQGSDEDRLARLYLKTYPTEHVTWTMTEFLRRVRLLYLDEIDDQPLTEEFANFLDDAEVIANLIDRRRELSNALLSVYRGGDFGGYSQPSSPCEALVHLFAWASVLGKNFKEGGTIANREFLEALYPFAPSTAMTLHEAAYGEPLDVKKSWAEGSPFRQIRMGRTS